MELTDQVKMMLTRRPLLMGWLLAMGWLAGILFFSWQTDDFTTVFALSQALIIQLLSNLVYALWFIGKLTVIYVLLKVFLLLVKLCRTDKSTTTVTTEYLKHMCPLYEQMFVFFFSFFIDFNRIGDRISEIIDQKITGRKTLKPCKQWQWKDFLFISKANQKKDLSGQLFEHIKTLFRKLTGHMNCSSDVEKAPLPCNLVVAPKPRPKPAKKSANSPKRGGVKKIPIIKLILSHGSKRITVQAVISSSSTCSLITEKAANELALSRKCIWPVLFRESISQPLRICTQVVQVRMEAVKPHEHICHQMEMLLVKEITSRFAKGHHVDVYVGQDCLNWAVNMLPVQRSNFLFDATHFNTQFGPTQMGFADSEAEEPLITTGDTDEDQTERKGKQMVKVLPWRSETMDEEALGCKRDMTLLFVSLWLLGIFTYFDLLLTITLLMTCLMALLTPLCYIYDRDILASPGKYPRRLFHHTLENLFIFLYTFRLLWQWMWKQSSQLKDPVLYKPTLKVRVRSTETEIVCRVLFDTTRAQSYISRSVLKYLGNVTESKPSASKITVELEALHDENIRATVDLVLTRKIFWDYLPTPPQELREVISVQHGIQLTDDTPEAETFGTVDVVIGTHALVRHFLQGRSACIYLGPNLTLTPSRFGWTLAGCHYPLLQKSLNTIYANHARVLRYLSYYLLPFLGRCMGMALFVSVAWDIVHYFQLVDDISTVVLYENKMAYLSNCDNFRMKTDDMVILGPAGYVPKLLSCWLYRSTFFQLLPKW